MSKLSKEQEMFRTLFSPYCSREYKRIYDKHYIGAFNVFKFKNVNPLLKKNSAILLTSTDPFERWVGELLLSEYKKLIPLNSQKINADGLLALILNKIIANFKDHLFCLEEVGTLNSFDLTMGENVLAGFSRLIEAPLLLANKSDEPVYYTYPLNTSWAIRWPDMLIDDKYYARAERSGLIYYKEIKTPSSREQEIIEKKRSSSYKKKDFSVVDLKLNNPEEFDNKEHYEEYNELDFKKFINPMTEDTSPIHNFQFWMRDHLGVNLEEDYFDYYITREDNKYLSSLCEHWTAIFHNGFSTRESVSNLLFFHGPSSFAADPPWAQPGKLYRKKKKKK